MADVRGRLVSILFCCIAVASCGSSSSTGPSGSRRYTVRYDVSGSFSDCTFFYITRRDDVAPDQENLGGDSRTDTGGLPWSLTYDVTVTALHPFNTQVGAVCSASGSETVTTTITVDGEEVATQTQSGQNVSAQAGFELTVGG